MLRHLLLGGSDERLQAVAKDQRALPAVATLLYWCWLENYKYSRYGVEGCYNRERPLLCCVCCGHVVAAIHCISSQDLNFLEV